MSNAAAVAARTRELHAHADARAEDLAWMAETGETVTGAAKRLGISKETLEKWCARHGHLDLFRALARHEEGAAVWRPNSYARRRMD